MSPSVVVASVVSLYWACVFFMSIRSWVKFGVPSGSLPKTKLEKRMWMIWVPTIGAWIAFAWQHGSHAATNNALVYGLQWTFATCAVIAFLLTVSCWLKMGRNWSMAVRPDKKTELITDGLFASIRHPIYSFSLMLMICTVVVIHSWSLLVVGVVHCSMLILKSLNEEKYLTRVHGQQYEDYLQRTNRFVPMRWLANRG